MAVQPQVDSWWCKQRLGTDHIKREGTCVSSTHLLGGHPRLLLTLASRNARTRQHDQQSQGSSSHYAVHI